jgi:hypothetical protein
MGEFQAFKTWLVDYLDVSRDALHIFVGLAVFLLMALLFRLSLRDWRPLAAVLFAALAGEAWDLFESWRFDRAYRWDLGWHDVWMTLAWPAILFVLARWTRVLKR